MVKQIIRITFLVLFLLQIAYMSYYLPQLMIAKGTILTKEIKLSLVITAFSIGILYFIREKIIESKPSKDESHQDSHKQKD
jgi:hypothetical protein